MAGKHRPKISKQVRLAAYERDNWTCQYCGLAFDPKHTWNPNTIAPWMENPEVGFVMLELDHVLPRKLGGDDSIENLRAACTTCNKRKLATTSHTMWDVRIGLAQTVLSTGPATEETAVKAAALLLGYLQKDLPRIKGLREAGF